MKTLLGQERIDHIAEKRRAARGELERLATKLARQLSYYEVFDLMIGAIEDRAGCGADEIRRKSADITENCANISRIGAKP